MLNACCQFSSVFFIYFSVFRFLTHLKYVAEFKECGTRGLCLHIVWQTNRQNYPVLVLMGELDNRAAVSLAFCITSRNSPCIQKLLLANATLPLNIHPRVYCSTEDAFVENQFILPWPSTRTIMCTWRLKHTW